MKFGAPARPKDHWSASRFDLTIPRDLFYKEVVGWAMERLGSSRIGRRTRVWDTYVPLLGNSDFARITIWPKDGATDFMLKWGSDPRLVDGVNNKRGSSSSVAVDYYTHWVDGGFDDIRPILEWCIANLPDYHWDWGGQGGSWSFWMKTDTALELFHTTWGDKVSPAPRPDQLMERHMRNALVGHQYRIRVISLWQPWASLIFAGKKEFETRGFRFPENIKGQRIAIHAAQKMPSPSNMGEELHQLCVETFGSDYRKTLPRGAVLGTVELGDCSSSCDLRPTLSDQNRITGNWAPERFGWELIQPALLPSPVMMKGHQGWWTVPAADLFPVVARST